MTDEKDNQDTGEETPDADGPRAGERLRKARRAHEMSVADVAKELHLDEYKIRALEQNQFDVLGAPVFAKGHLRKYAQLVHVDIDDVLADYYALDRASAAPPVVGDIRKPSREIAVGPWIVAIGVVLALAFVYWYFVNGSDAEAPPPESPPDARPAGTGQEPETAALPATGAPSVTGEPAVPPVGITSEAPAEVMNEAPGETAGDAPARPAPTTVDSPPSSDDGDVRLVLRFTGECWTEISDASGRRLYFDLGRDGRVVDVSGEPPLAVLLGNVDNVSVEVNGDDYAINASDRRGQTAQFTIQAP